MQELSTIGHSNHLLEYFLRLLTSQSISVVADVRSSPYSRYWPQYNKDSLERSLKDADIKYIFLGRELGARRSEDSCYIDGQVRFEFIAKLPIFRAGLDRVLSLIEQNRVALLCAEAEPLNCHRTILICRQLRKIRQNIKISHILRNGATESHEETERRLVRLHNLQPELFGKLTSTSDLIEKAYDLQAEKITYKKTIT